MSKLREQVKFFSQVFDMTRLSVKICNDVHNTTTYMTVNAEQETVTGDEIDRVARELCGMDDCSCQSVPINGRSAIDTDGNSWVIV